MLLYLIGLVNLYIFQLRELLTYGMSKAALDQFTRTLAVGKYSSLLST